MHIVDDINNDDLLIETDYSSYEERNIDGCFISKHGTIKNDLKIIDKNGSNNSVFFGLQSTVIKSRVIFYGDNNKVIFGPYTDVRQLDLRLKGSDNTFLVGAFSSIGEATVIISNAGKITISAFCMFSTGIVIDNSDHHSIYDLDSGEKINKDSDIVFNKNVWAGRKTIFSKGTNVGSNSVIAQGAICSGYLENNSIYGGVPARKIRSNITWSRMNSESLDEMESSSRHKLWLNKVDNLKKLFTISKINTCE